MQKIALFGGSFDPPHLAHLEILKQILVQKNFDKVFVLPTAYPNHKKGQRLLPFSLRFQLAKIAFDFDEKIEVKDIEYFLEAPTRTVHTLEYLLSKEPAEYTLVIGEDEFRYLPSWYHFERLASLCTFLVIPRGLARAEAEENLQKTEKEELQLSLEDLQAQYEHKYGLKSELLAFSPLAIASRELRPLLEKVWDEKLCQNHIDLEHLSLLSEEEKEKLKKALPQQVLTYLLDTRLYALFKKIKMELSAEDYQKYLEYDKIAYEHEGLKRCVHSQHVALLAYYYALKHNLEQQGFLPSSILFSAVLHDIAKYFSKEECLKYIPEKSLEGLVFPLWHAPVGEAYLKEKALYTEEEGLKAIRHHATLEENSTLWEQLLFLADKIEYSRPYTDLEELRLQLNDSISEATLSCLYTIAKLLAPKGVDLSATHRAIADLEKLK